MMRSGLPRSVLVCSLVLSILSVALPAAARQLTKLVVFGEDCLRIRADRSTTWPPDGLLAKDSVSVLPASDFYATRGPANYVRLAYSYASPSEITEGVRRLGEAFREIA